MKAHLIRGALYLLLVPAVCVIPFALGQRTTDDRSATKIAHLPATSTDSGTGALAMAEFPTNGVIANPKSPVAHPNHKKAH
jgi:hypothetical protein